MLHEACLDVLIALSKLDQIHLLELLFNIVSPDEPPVKFLPILNFLQPGDGYAIGLGAHCSLWW